MSSSSSSSSSVTACPVCSRASYAEFKCPDSRLICTGTPAHRWNTCAVHRTVKIVLSVDDEWRQPRRCICEKDPDDPIDIEAWRARTLEGKKRLREIEAEFDQTLALLDTLEGHLNERKKRRLNDRIV